MRTEQPVPSTRFSGHSQGWRAGLWRPRIWLAGLVLGAIAASAPTLAIYAGQDDTSSEKDDAPAVEPVDEEDEKLPKLADMELPSFQRLMQGPAFDWLVTISGKVITAEPVAPRPGTIEAMNQQIKKSMRRAGEPAETEETKRRRLDLYYLPVTLTEGEEREYRLHIRYLKEIIYYEDLMLRRIDQLLDNRKVRQAYELVLALEARQDDWPGVAARKDRLLFTEATVRSGECQDQHALALLESLHERRPSYTGLEAQFGVVVDQLISAAAKTADLRGARFFLRRLIRRYPNHSVARDWTTRFTQAARDQLDKALSIERTGDIATALDAAEEAARNWPELPELVGVYNRLALRRQRLYVGVVDLPGSAPTTAPVLLSAAETRRRQLTQTLLFEPARLENKFVRYESRMFSDWEPTQLGHSVLFRLRPYRVPSESQPSLTAAGLAWGLARRMTPDSDAYDARFAATVDGLEVRSPFELAVHFQQVPLRPESLFAFPCPAPQVTTTDASGSATSPEPDVTYPFRLQATGDQQAVYQRTVPDPENTSDHRISEVIERKYDTYARAIQGILRGEVSFLPRVPAYQIRALASRPEFFTQPYALPSPHVLQFNPHTRALGARTLRRALVYALNRPQILEQVFLHEEPGALGRVISAPFATTSYAYSSDGARKVEPHKFDSALAFSLAKTAEKELAGPLPVLRLICGPDPEIQAAAARIVDSWKAVGIQAELRVAPSASPVAGGGVSDWDIIYRTDVMPEPLVDLWPYLALTTSTETAALAHLPMWLRKRLLELDRVGDLNSAADLLHLFHELFWAEVHLIPLWELDDVLVYRKNIRGIPERPLATYQKIERWKVEPWFAREAPQ